MDTINLQAHVHHVLSIALLVITLLHALLAMIRMPQEIIVTAILATIEMKVLALHAEISVYNAIVQEFALNARRMQDHLPTVIVKLDTITYQMSAPSALIHYAESVIIQEFAINARQMQDHLPTVIV